MAKLKKKSSIYSSFIKTFRFEIKVYKKLQSIFLFSLVTVTVPFLDIPFLLPLILTFTVHESASTGRRSPFAVTLDAFLDLLNSLYSKSFDLARYHYRPASVAVFLGPFTLPLPGSLKVW